MHPSILTAIPSPATHSHTPMHPSILTATFSPATLPCIPPYLQQHSVQQHSHASLHTYRNMQYNNIPEIFPGTFNGSQVSFSSITLRDNSIEVVHPGAFAGVAERGLIDLSLNALSTVPDGVFVTSYSTV